MFSMLWYASSREIVLHQGVQDTENVECYAR